MISYKRHANSFSLIIVNSIKISHLSYFSRFNFQVIIILEKVRQSANINMSIYPKSLAVIASSFLSLVMVNISEAQAGSFTFTRIADNKNYEGFLDVGGGPINDNGTVAFAASTLTGTGIFTGNGQTVTEVVNPNLGYSVNGLAINNTGTVAFGNFSSSPQEGLFVTNGGNPTPVATRSDSLFTIGVSPNAFNNNGTLVFILFGGIGSPVSSPVIVTGNGESLTTVADTSGAFSFFDQEPAINDNNVVAFTATLKDGRQGVFTIKDGAITTIADNTSFFSGGFFDIDINNRETVVFNASLNNGEEGVFIGNGETVRTVVDTIGPFSRFSRSAINDFNQVAFNATFRNGAQNVFADGIFTGPNPITDKVIAIGDSLFGGTVTNLFLIEVSIIPVKFRFLLTLKIATVTLFVVFFVPIRCPNQFLNSRAYWVY